MAYDAQDTIAAVASAPGGAARGIVRLSGPRAIECLARCFAGADRVQPHGNAARRWAGAIHALGGKRQPPLVVPGHAFVWPLERSFTREPAAEFHAVASPPLLAAVLDEFCRCGARPADPGEFTLRAFLAGRIDLTQAEAVLGVVDARNRGDLDDALDQLAGGLSRPLHELREQLLAVLAEVEAGLDFADEPIEFISRNALAGRLAGGRAIVAATLQQLSGRDRPAAMPRIALTGAPNVGKSSLFNALVKRFGIDPAVRSLVAPQPGATRDYVTARLALGGMECELIDAAGVDAASCDNVHHAAQRAAASQQRRADVRLYCVPAGEPINSCDAALDACFVVTKCDLAAGAFSASNAVSCSSVTGEGLELLIAEIRRRLDQGPAAAAATAARCLTSLRDADQSLEAAVETAGIGDELLAAEIRTALNAIGEVVGAVCADDVLDRVFTQFCIGK